MQREIERLQSQARQGEWTEEQDCRLSPPVTVDRPDAESPTSPSNFATPQHENHRSWRDPQLRPPAFSSPSETNQGSLKNFQLGPLGYMTSHQQFIATASRTLDGLELEARKIDDCFELFFEHYYPYLPILEVGYKPNQYYAYSPLLFWTIIAIGSRRYRDDPTLLQALMPRVSALTLQSLCTISLHIPTIQSVLLLCTWPFPTESIFNDPSMVLSGAAMQLAVQNGLHMLSKRQDFTRTRLGQNEIQETFRYELWAYCKIVCQTTNIRTGLQPYIVADASDLPRQRQDIIELLPQNLYWAQKLQKIFSNAINTLMHNNFISEQETSNSCIGSLINVFDEQILDISRHTVNDHHSLKILLARVHIRVFHLFDSCDDSQQVKLVELHHIVCCFVETVSAADQKNDFALYLSEMIYWTLSLAACTILRIHRSELRTRIDISLGEKCFFNVVHIMKKRSLQNNDLSSRGAIILTQLWQSKQVFRQLDGTFNSLRVRIRSRGSMGVAYDCFWYWRQEFNGQADPYSDLSNKADISNVSKVTAPWYMDGTGVEGLDAILPGSDGRIYPNGEKDENFFQYWDWPSDYLFST